MADFSATSRVPTRPLSYANKDMAYRKELLVDYTNGLIYVIDENGNEHDVSKQVYEYLVQSGDVSKVVTVVIPDGQGGTTTVTIEEAITYVLEQIDAVNKNMEGINKLVEKMIDDSGEVAVDPSTIVQDATHRFLTDAQISKIQEKITIVEKVITIAPGDIIGSEAPYNCVKAVEGLNPSYPAPTIDIKYTNNVFADNEKEEDAYYTIHRCQILAANEATFTFKNKPETAFQVLFQIKVPGID